MNIGKKLGKKIHDELKSFQYSSINSEQPVMSCSATQVDSSSEK